MCVKYLGKYAEAGTGTPETKTIEALDNSTNIRGNYLGARGKSTTNEEYQLMLKKEGQGINRHALWP